MYSKLACTTLPTPRFYHKLSPPTSEDRVLSLYLGACNQLGLLFKSERTHGSVSRAVFIESQTKIALNLYTMLLALTRDHPSFALPGATTKAPPPLEHQEILQRSF